MEAQKKQPNLFDIAILDRIESKAINKKHALQISSAVFSTESSQKNIRKEIIAAHIQHKTVILELETNPAFASNPALESILPLCHVIAGSPHAFQQVSKVKDTDQALLHIRNKSDATLVLTTGEKSYHIFEKEIVGKIT